MNEIDAANITLRKRLNLLGQKREEGGGGEEKGMRGSGWRAPPYLPYPLKTMKFSLSGSICTIAARKGEKVICFFFFYRYLKNRAK